MNPFLPSEIDLSFTLKKRNGALLYADLIGFTEMSEKFAERGILGTGELTQIIDRCFESQLSVVRKYGGDVVEFIGDALFIKFKKFGSAKKCAAEMAQRIKYFSDIETSAGKFSLSMRIILSKGSWNELILGTPEKLLFFLTGGILKKIAQHEKKTVKGEVVTVESAVKMDRKKARDVSSTLRKREKKAFLPEFSEKIPRKESYGEFRSVACVFLRIEGYDEENPDLESLNSTCIKIIESVHKHRGSINDTDNAVTEGSKLLILFGAPVAFGDECQRAVEFALDVTGNSSSNKGVKISASVGAGYVFAGMIGDKKRRKYSVIGDVVNTTARILDGLSKGETAVTEDVYRMTKNKIDYVRMKSVSVKGKKDMLKRFKPRGFKFDSASRRPFVGREKELKTVIERILKEKCVLVLKGQAGIGKTRLIEEVSRIVRAKGVAVFRANADEHKPAFNILSSLVKNICSIFDEDSESRKLSKVKRAFEKTGKTRIAAGDVAVVADVLFGIETGDERFKNLTPELKKQNLIDALMRLLETVKGPYCVVMDDLQWAKAEDLETINYLTRKALIYSQTKARFILSSRPEAIIGLEEDKIETIKINLKPFENKTFNDYVEQVLGGKRLEERVLKAVVSRSEKNPFYADQILSYLRDKNLITEKANEWQADVSYTEDELPESLFSIVTARIDKLGEKIRESLKVASAIGMEFKLGVVEEVTRKKGEKNMKSAVEIGLINLTDQAELEYIFSHALFKDVIYQSILAEKRKAIHSAVARSLEKEGRGSIKEYLFSLAHHYDLAENWKKAFKYRFKAGIKFKNEYLNEESITNFERAAVIARENLFSKIDEARALEELTEICFITGKNEKSLEFARNLEILGLDDPIVNSKIERFKARCLSGESSLKKSAAALEKTYGYLNGKSAECIKEKIYNSLAKAFVYRELFDPDKALSEALKAEKIFQNAKNVLKDPKTEVRVIREIGTAYYQKYNFDRSVEMYAKALEIGKRINDKFIAASSMSNIGVVYQSKGEYTKALEYYKMAETVCGEIGDNRGLCLSKLNIGCAQNDLNQVDLALKKFEEALKLAVEMNLVKTIMFLYINIGNSYNNKGYLKEAAVNTEKALLYAEELKDYTAMARISENLGNIYNRQNKFDKALDCFKEALGYLKLAKDLKWAVYVSEKLSLLELEKMEYLDAIRNLRTALRISRKIKFFDGVLEGLTYIRDLLCETGKFEKSKYYSVAADEVCDKCREKEIVAIYFLCKAIYVSEIKYLHGSTENDNAEEKAETLMKKALTIIEEIKGENLRIQYYYSLGKIMRLNKNYKESMDNLETAKKLASSRGMCKELAKIYLETSLVLKETGNPKASFFLEKSVREYIKMKNEKRARWVRKIFSECPSA